MMLDALMIPDRECERKGGRQIVKLTPHAAKELQAAAIPPDATMSSATAFATDGSRPPPAGSTPASLWCFPSARVLPVSMQPAVWESRLAW